MTQKSFRAVVLRLPLCVVAAPLVTGSGCEEGSEPGIITLEFVTGVGSQDLVFDQLLYTVLNTDSSSQNITYSVEGLRFYVSSFVLHAADAASPQGPFRPLHGGGGEDAEFDLVHYVDARDPATLTLQLDDIPIGGYNQLSFTFGLNETLNTTDTLSATPENVDMKWPVSLGGGYHYMKLDGRFIDGPDTTAYSLHTGRTGTVPHFFSVYVPLPGLDVFDSHHITIGMDLNEWFRNPNDFRLRAGDIKGDVAVQDTLRENGETPVFSLIDLHSHGH